MHVFVNIHIYVEYIYIERDKQEGVFELYETNAQPTMSNNSRNMNDTHVRIMGKGQR